MRTTPGKVSEEDTLTVSQAAEKSGLSDTTIRRRLAAGDIKGKKVKGVRGEEWRIDLVSWKEFMRNPRPVNQVKYRKTGKKAIKVLAEIILWVDSRENSPTEKQVRKHVEYPYTFADIVRLLDSRRYRGLKPLKVRGMNDGTS